MSASGGSAAALRRWVESRPFHGAVLGLDLEHLDGDVPHLRLRIGEGRNDAREQAHLLLLAQVDLVVGQGAGVLHVDQQQRDHDGRSGAERGAFCRARVPASGARFSRREAGVRCAPLLCGHSPRCGTGLQLLFSKLNCSIRLQRQIASI
mgnify:CR=1 FL=1